MWFVHFCILYLTGNSVKNPYSDHSKNKASLSFKEIYFYNYADFSNMLINIDSSYFEMWCAISRPISVTRPTIEKHWFIKQIKGPSFEFPMSLTLM
jgi:hypothetical protein